MLRELTARQYAEWQVIYGIEPWGEWRADLRMGILATAVVAPHLKPGAKTKPADFMPDFMPDFTKNKKKKPKQTPEEQAAVFRQAAAVWGKK